MPSSSPNPPYEAPSVGLWASLGVLAKRWPWVLVGVVLTAIAGYAVVKVVPVTYSAKGTMLLQVPEAPAANPNTPGTTPPTNPFAVSRGFVGNLLVTIMADPDAAERVLGRGGAGTFEIQLSQGDASLVHIETTGKTEAEALETWRAASEETQSSLSRMQKDKGVADVVLIKADAFTAPARAEKESGSRIRALVAILVLGLGGTLMIAFGAESLSQYRRLQRRPQSPGSDGDASSATGGGPTPGRGPDADDLVSVEDFDLDELLADRPAVSEHDLEIAFGADDHDEEPGVASTARADLQLAPDPAPSADTPPLPAAANGDAAPRPVPSSANKQSLFSRRDLERLSRRTRGLPPTGAE